LIAAQLFTELGFISDACDCYAEVYRLCPNTRIGLKAACRMEALCASVYPETPVQAPETKPVSEPKEDPDEEQAAVPAGPTHVFTNYDVSDLVGEVAGGDTRRTPGELKLAHELKQFIETTIGSGSWKGQGGEGTIEYYPETNSL